MRVDVLAVGTELLLGQIVNTNASQIGERLAASGLDHFHQAVVGDNLERVATAIEEGCARSDALIITGGIGPTRDDLTREALCVAAGTPMGFDEDYATRLRDYWEARGRPMPDSNLRQAQVPLGAELIDNPKGTAPGLRMRLGDTWVFSLPGVPAEMLPMLEDDVLPFLRGEAGADSGVVVSRILRTWGESESKIGEMLEELFESAENPTLAFLASAGEIKVRLTAKAATRDEAVALIEPVEAEVRATLGSRVFGADDETVELVLLELLRNHRWSLGSAESMTGGLIAGRITAISGASDTYRGTIVAYDSAEKESLLSVPRELVESHGVVSEGVARAMAEGAASRLNVDVTVAVTGAAGPEPHGGREVGIAVIAVKTPESLQAKTLRLPGDRERIRTFGTTAALHLTRMSLQGVSWGN